MTRRLQGRLNQLHSSETLLEIVELVRLEMHQLGSKSGPDFHASHPKLTVQSHPKTAMSSMDSFQLFDSTNVLLHSPLLEFFAVQESTAIGNGNQ